ncbi:unnamed protein product [Mesocestoides corti]|uniref:CARMIL C-terminal domain-containing protein n=1 Tax=Mesocestoides corti TaxID=53468 RepID=A0A158QTD1_MESCO|nr:unnamed protein product [Mesocestoides corti]
MTSSKQESKNDFVHFKTLQEFLSMTPNLRVLTLDGCQVDIAEACDALYKSNCTRLEKLGLSSNKFETSAEVVRDYFASLKFLQLLNLQDSVGDAAVDVLKMIFEGLALVKGPVYDQLRLNLQDCRLGPEAGSLIARQLPELSQVTQITLSDNPFERSIFEIIKCLPKCQRLVHIALGSRDKSSATAPDRTLDLLAQTLSEPACLGSTGEMSNFLSRIAENGHRLNHLDVRDYALKDDESGCLFKLLQYTTSPITIQFNISNLKPKTIMRLNCLIKRKWPMARVQVPNRLYVAHDDQVVVVMHKPSAESVENAIVPVFPDVQLMMELEKFDDALLTPSTKFVEADLELTRYETKLRHLMPMENVEQLEAAIPKVHQANLVLTECSKLPTMQIDLLEAALDPEKCNHAVDTAVGEMQESLLKSLEASYKETCDYLRDVIHKNYRQSLASVIEMNSDLNESTREDISLMLNQRLKSAIRSTILELNVRLAEEMLLKITKDLKEEVKTCLEGFPKRREFMPYQRMEKSESEYANYSETPDDYASPIPGQYIGV